MALKYNRVFNTINPEPVYAPGLYFTGPFVSYWKYPRTLLTMEYDSRHRDVLDGRTSDGLPLSLQVAFQYKLMPDKLFHLYDTFESDYEAYQDTYKLFGIHLLTEISTNYTAYQFFNEKQRIADDMRKIMDSFFQEKLFAEVVSLQINDDTLPEEFTNSVLRAAIVKQNIAQMTEQKKANVVEFQTDRIVAENQANVTIQKARGQSYKILQDARADASIVELQAQAETEAYNNIKGKLEMKGDNLVKYIWYDTISGGSVTGSVQDQDVQMLIGVHPSSYID